MVRSLFLRIQQQAHGRRSSGFNDSFFFKQCLELSLQVIRAKGAIRICLSLVVTRASDKLQYSRAVANLTSELALGRQRHRSDYRNSFVHWM